MSKSLHNFIIRTKKVAMTASEKRAMIFSILGSSLSPSKYSLVSPYSVFSFFTYAHRKRAIAFAAIALLIMTCAGTSYAAESALPGEPLYPIKLNVNEGFDSFVAITPDAKVKVEVNHAKTRLQEAETLSKKGQLNAQNQSIIETNLQKHADTIKANVSVLASEDATDTVKDALSDLTNSLTANAAVLATASSSDALATQVNQVKNEISTIDSGNASSTASVTAAATTTPATTASSTPASNASTTADVLDASSTSSSTIPLINIELIP